MKDLIHSAGGDWARIDNGDGSQFIRVGNVAAISGKENKMMSGDDRYECTLFIEGGVALQLHGTSAAEAFDRLRGIEIASYDVLAHVSKEIA